MKRQSLPAGFLVLFLLSPAIVFANQSPVSVLLQSPGEMLKMGDVPQFEGRITNTGRQPIEGLIVYLSLVSLQPGRERPVDLEDWSAQKAVRIDRLDPGEKPAAEMAHTVNSGRSFRGGAYRDRSQGKLSNNQCADKVSGFAKTHRHCESYFAGGCRCSDCTYRFFCNDL